MWILLHQGKIYYFIYLHTLVYRQSKCLSLAKYKSKNQIQSSSTGKKNQGIAPNRKSIKNILGLNSSSFAVQWFCLEFLNKVGQVFYIFDAVSTSMIFSIQKTNSYFFLSKTLKRLYLTLFSSSFFFFFSCMIA